MNDKVYKSERISSRELGISLSFNLSPKYWEKKKAQQERWAREDAEKAKKSK